MDYPKQINLILEKMSLNQTGLAKAMGVSRGIVSEFSNGSREPSKEFLFGLSKLGISIDWFITGAGSMFLPGWNGDGYHQETSSGKLDTSSGFTTPEDEIIELAKKILSMANELKTKISESEVEAFLAKYTKLSPERQAKVMNYIEILLDQQNSEDSIPEPDQKTG
jgi:transcriptional regulator with XRE-family HTH domain